MKKKSITAHNPLFKLLWQMPSKDWHWFDKFLKSPVYNSNKELVEYFGFLKYRFLHKLEIPRKEKILRHFNPVLDEAKYHHLNSYLRKLLDEYLAWKEWSQNKLQKQIDTQTALSKYTASNIQEKKLKKSEHIFNTHPLRDANYFQKSYELDKLRFELKARQKRFGELEYQGLINKQELAFMIERLKLACLTESHRSLKSSELQQSLINHIISYLNKNNHPLTHPVLAIYYHAYCCSLDTEENVDAFFELKERLNGIKELISRKEQSDLLRIAINFCIRQINKSKFEYLAEVYQFYKTGIDSGLLIEDGFLSPYTYNNTVISGLKLDKTNEVLAFIHAKKELLPKEKQESSFEFNLARFYFETNDYNQAMPLLSQMKYEDPLHVLAGKTMLSKIYMEEGEFDLLENHLASFRSYLRRKNISNYHKDNYRNFIKFLLQICRHYEDKKRLEKVFKELKTIKPLTEKEWLIRQIRN